MRLILLNGPPGIGKSTIAARYLTDHPWALLLDLDADRDDLDDEAAGLLAREAGLEAARARLETGNDVVVPQLLAREPFIKALERLAVSTGAEFHELVLMAPKEVAIKRVNHRSDRRRKIGQPDPQGEAIARAGGVAELDATYDRLSNLLKLRPDAVIIASQLNEIDRTYADVLRAMGR